MKIGIIGAGIAGLTAGRELARAGHEVTVVEKSHGFGGRLATEYTGEEKKVILDYGLSFLTAESPEFRGFIAELLNDGLVKVWGDHIWQHDGKQLLETGPNETSGVKYVAEGGMNRIAGYLARSVDIQAGVKAGGVTFIGANRGRKRAWMINLTNYNTVEVDAVIIAAPAPQAYSILLTTRDETDSLKLIREIDEIDYDPVYTLMAGYGELEAPRWDAVTCNDSAVRFVVNEKSKRELPETALVIHSTPDFARNHRDGDPVQAAAEMLKSAGEIAGSWAARPEWSRTCFWRFARAAGSIEKPYMQFASDNAPLAVIGDYFTGNRVDHAYTSGLKLAGDWIETYRSF